MQRRSFIAAITAFASSLLPGATALAAAGPVTKVFKLNEFEWYAAPSLAAAVAAWKKETGCDDDALDEPRELTEKEMDTIKFHSDDEGILTFREELRLQRQRTGEYTGFFATTEY